MQDPITQIKQAEEEGKKQLEKLTTQLHLDLEDEKAKLNKKVQEFEEGLRERGLKKLGTVQQEAGELYKSKVASTDSEKTKIKGEAATKEASGIQLIEKVFTEHLKS